jgi:plastocyanin
MDFLEKYDQAELLAAQHSRRRVLRSLLTGGAGLLGLSTFGIAGTNYVRATDDGGDGGDGDNSSPGGDGDDNDDDDLTPTITGDIPAGSNEIRIVSDDAGGFVPAELTVDVGESVTFVNTHSDEHTATGSGFDTGIIPEGGTATVKLDEPGTFAYACQIHPEMTGSVVVRGAEGEASPETTQPENDLSGTWTATLTGSTGDINSVQALVTYREDGTLEATYEEVDTGLDVDLGPAQGSWSRGESGSFRSTTVAFLLDSDQRFAGTLTLREEAQLDDSGNAFQGTFTYEMKDADGIVTSEGEGKTEGTRVRAEDEATPGASPPGGSAQVTTIAIQNFAFDPPSIEVPAGTTVTWRNDDSAPHTATALDGAFDTGQIDQGQEGQFTFDQAGTFDYRCDFHPQMHGTVVVT